MLSFGATACLSKETEARDMINAIHLASRGMHVLPRSAAAGGGVDRLGMQGTELTPREAEVLELLQEGPRTRRSRRRSTIGIETVRTHARNIYRKLGVPSRRELARRAQQEPIVVDDERRPVRAASGRAQQAAHVQQLGQLDGVGGRALAQVVAHDPEVQAALVRGVAADAPDQHVVAAGGVERRRVEAVRRVVDDRQPGRAGQQLAALLGRQRLARLDVRRHRVARVHGHARAGGGHADVLRGRGSCASRACTCAPRSCSRRRP